MSWALEEIFLVLPVKPLEGGKQRLTSGLSGAARNLVARALDSQTLRCVAETWPRDQVCVVGRDPELDRLCQRLGLASLGDPGEGQSRAVREGQGWALDRGAQVLATIAADLPSVTGEDVLRVLDLARSQPSGSITLFPDAVGSGSNGLILSPASLDPFLFGPDSARRHREWAMREGIEFRVVSIPGLAWDVDRPEDLEEPGPGASGRGHPVLDWARQVAELERERRQGDRASAERS